MSAIADIIGVVQQSNSTEGVTIHPPKLVNGVPSLDGFSEQGTKLGQLDLMLWQYTQGLIDNVQSARQSGGLLNNQQLVDVVGGITGDIEGAQEAAALAQKLKGAIDQTFGVGSVVGRFTDSIFSGDIIGAISGLLSGRTWRYDQYQLATNYSYHVLGKDIGDTTHASDELVIEACKWCIDRLGVFINGARTLYAFINPLKDGLYTNRPGSPMEYMILVNENPFITIDQARVNAAYNVVRTYMPNVHVPGNWKGTIGVYDRELVALAKQGYGNYYNNLAALKQEVASGNTGVLNSTESTGSNVIVYVVIAIVIIFLIILIVRK